MSTDESFREFESAANKTAIARQHEMEAARAECLRLTIELLSARECMERIGRMDKPHPLSEGWPAQVAREWLQKHPQ